MARFKTYYPTSEITINLYTSGKQWMTIDTVEYIGSYHRYLTGEVYTKSQWEPGTSISLIPYIDNTVSNKNLPYINLKPDIQLARISPKAHNVIVTVDDVKLGVLQRFFLKKRNDNTIIEINKQQYDAWKSDELDKKLHVAIEIAWFITGPINDTVTDTRIAGVSTLNQQRIQLAAKTIPEITLYLTDPLQFYTDTEYIISKDINK